MRKKKKRRYYALPCMVAIAVVAVLAAGSGFVLRRTLLKGLPQYDGQPDIAIPMMLLQDSGPLREARARAEWEAAEREAAQQADAAPAAELTVEPAPAEAPTPEPAAEAAPVEAPTPEPAAIAVFSEASTAEPASAMTAAPTELPTEAPTPQPTPEPTPEPTEVPAPTEVPESFFDHTLFIGDSKTDGMRMWGRLGQAQYFCGTNYSVYNIFDKKASDADFKNASLDKVLASHKYDQIYILLGYNEAGYPFESLMDQFRYVIARVHKAQPKARMILHGIMHASAGVGAKYSYYSVENLETVNEGLRQLAEDADGLFYVDCNAPFCDEDGYLLPDVSADGEHLTPEYTAQWAQEIRRQAVTD
ncbi:MAG: GDSL-type esterase/lipase family protein [Clostridia bacterium]|nr:GDSL-type esterase/lipase family protein [Clostridia bacterium]